MAGWQTSITKVILAENIGQRSLHKAMHTQKYLNAKPQTKKTIQSCRTQTERKENKSKNFENAFA